LFPRVSTAAPVSGELSWSESRLARVANIQTQPRERTMTIDRMTLKALLEKGSDDDLLRQMIGFVANRMMDLEVEGLTGAARGERALARVNLRKGCRERAWERRAGRVELAIPKLRKSSYFAAFLEARRAAEKALVAVIQEACVQGVSTRSVDDLVKAMGM